MRLFGKSPSAQLLPCGQRLTFSAKVARLKERLKQPEWRRYGALILVGKFLGVALVFGLIIGVPILISELPKVMCGTAMGQESTDEARRGRCDQTRYDRTCHRRRCRRRPMSRRPAVRDD